MDAFLENAIIIVHKLEYGDVPQPKSRNIRCGGKPEVSKRKIGKLCGNTGGRGKGRTGVRKCVLFGVD